MISPWVEIVRCHPCSLLWTHATNVELTTATGRRGGGDGFHIIAVSNHQINVCGPLKEPRVGVFYDLFLCGRLGRQRRLEGASRRPPALSSSCAAAFPCCCCAGNSSPVKFSESLKVFILPRSPLSTLAAPRCRGDGRRGGLFPLPPHPSLYGW